MKTSATLRHFNRGSAASRDFVRNRRGRSFWQRFDAATSQWPCSALVLTSAVFAFSAILWLHVPSTAWGQATKKAPVAGSVQGEDQTLTASDGWPIHITYFPSEKGKESAVIVLLHMKGRNQLAWQQPQGGFVRRLLEQGYAVVTVDLRKHGRSIPDTAGDSKTPPVDASTLRAADYQLMVVADLEAVKQFLLAEHQKGKLNVRKLGIVAPEMSAPLAINFTIADWAKPPYNDAPAPRPGQVDARTPRGQDVQALALLSPMGSVPGVSITRSIGVLKNLPVAVFIGVGKTDKLDRGQAARLYAQLGGNNPNREGVYLAKYPSNSRGTDLLYKKLKVEEHLLGFFKKHVQDLDAPWRDRKSRLLD